VYRVGIVGFGRIAESAHLPAWLSLPDVQVVAIADACPERRAHAAALLPDARVFSHVEAMLAEETIDSPADTTVAKAGNAFSSRRARTEGGRSEEVPTWAARAPRRWAAMRALDSPWRSTCTGW